MIQVEITTTEVGVTEQVTTLVEIAGAGPQGPQGDPGVGIPKGGDTNALLAKTSPADDDADWTNVPTVYGLQLDTTTQADPATGRIIWNDGDQVPQFVSNGITVDLSLELLARCRNVTGSTIPKGTAVCIVGASAQRISIAPSNRSEPGSACRTLGLTLENIPTNQFGKVSTFGLVRGLNTNAIDGAEGDELFVGATPGSLTTTPPDAPARRLTVGYLVTKNTTQGRVFVSIRRGVRVAEIDDVQVTSITDGDVVRYVDANNRWENVQLGSAADADTGDFDPAGSASSVQSNLTTHIADDTNPHQVTASQVGLGNVDNTADLDKPISTNTQTALDAKADKTTQVIAGTGLDGGGNLSEDRTLNLDSATVSSLGLADTALQSGDNVSELTNDANYIDAAGAPVQSVNTQTGTVNLDAADVGADPSGSAAGVQSNLDSHTGATTSVHGIADTADLIIEGDARLTDERVPTDGSVTDAKVSATANIAQSKVANLVDDLNAKANLVSGKVPTSELPAIAITETFVVDDIAARDALTPEQGDVAIVQDRGDGEPASFIWDGTEWQKLLTPLKGVSDVLGVAPISSTGGDTPSISLDNLGVTEAKLADGAVTNAKVATNADIAPTKISGTAVVDNDARLTDERTPLNASVTDAKITGGGLSPTVITGTAVVDDDARLTDQRVPTDGSVTDTKITAGGLSPTAITGTAVVDGDARLSEGADNVETVRSLGTGATQALPGDFDVAGQAPVQSVNTQTGDVVLEKSDVGLGNVPNLDTTDAVNKAHDQNTDTVLAQGTANEVTAADARAHIDATDNPHGVTATQVGLGNVDNTADLDKPISTDTEAALDDKADNTIEITGTDGIEGGGDLTANRALKLTAAALASLSLADTALQPNDAATNIAYDNTASGLQATTVQAAIDEIVGILANVLELNTGS